MTYLPDARLLNPLIFSGLIAAAACAAAGIVVPPPQDASAASMLERLVHNPFVLIIAFVGIWALIYGTLQLCAIGSKPAGGITGWLSGQGRGKTLPLLHCPMDTASLFAERWDHLAARRAAPLSYAIWVLPLMGFIGTVIGISDAIGGLGTVFADGDRQEALASVLGALRFAFDTTFAGLVLVIPVMALSTLIELASDTARDRGIGRFADSKVA